MAEPLGRLTTALADRYRIERELGAGGMATVYLAQDLKHESLRSLYALTLHRQGDTRRAAELWREADAAAQRSLEAGAEGYGATMELAAINAILGHTSEALEWLERGYRAGWKDARLLNLDPFFASVRREPRYLALTTGMTQDVAEMRKRAATAHPDLFTPPPSAQRP